MYEYTAIKIEFYVLYVNMPYIVQGTYNLRRKYQTY